METVDSVVRGFFGDARVFAILLLIFVQVMFAVAAAIRQRKFDGAKLADYYTTMVVPYLIGTLALWVATRFMPPDILGPYSVIFGEGLFTLAWLTLVYTFLVDIFRNIKALGYPVDVEPQPPGAAGVPR